MKQKLSDSDLLLIYRVLKALQEQSIPLYKILVELEIEPAVFERLVERLGELKIESKTK